MVSCDQHNCLCIQNHHVILHRKLLQILLLQQYNLQFRQFLIIQKSFKIQKMLSKSIYQRRIEYTMEKGKTNNQQLTKYHTENLRLQGTLIRPRKQGWTQVLWKDKQFLNPAPLVEPVILLLNVKFISSKPLILAVPAKKVTEV